MHQLAGLLLQDELTCPPFLLTMLLGKQVYAAGNGTHGFADVTKTLKTLINRPDDWLPANPGKPTVRNPVLFEEIQSNALDDTKYDNFRERAGLELFLNGEPDLRVAGHTGNAAEVYCSELGGACAPPKRAIRACT